MPVPEGLSGLPARVQSCSRRRSKLTAAPMIRAPLSRTSSGVLTCCSSFRCPTPTRCCRARTYSHVELPEKYTACLQDFPAWNTMSTWSLIKASLRYNPPAYNFDKLQRLSGGYIGAHRQHLHASVLQIDGQQDYELDDSTASERRMWLCIALQFLVLSSLCISYWWVVDDLLEDASRRIAADQLDVRALDMLLAREVFQEGKQRAERWGPVPEVVLAIVRELHCAIRHVQRLHQHENLSRMQVAARSSLRVPCCRRSPTSWLQARTACG